MKILHFIDVQKNLEIESEAGIFQILPMFKKMQEMKVKREDYIFYNVQNILENECKAKRF